MLSKSETNKYIFNFLGRIFRNDAQGDGMPVQNSTSTEGFSKMPTAIWLYQLEHLAPWMDNEDDIDTLCKAVLDMRKYFGL